MSNVPKLRFREFSGDWEDSNIGTIANVSSGGTPSRSKKSYWNGTIPWVTTSLVNFKDIQNAEEYITEEGLNNSSAKLFPKNTILMAMYGQGKTRGQVGILKIEATTNQACAAINPKKIDYIFLFQYLINQYENIRNLSNEGGQKNLSASLIKNIPISYPSKQEQEKIASFLTAVDTKIEQLAKKEELLGQYKKGVMQKIFNQEIRFKPDDGSEFPEWKEKPLKTIFKERKLSATKSEGYEHISLTTEGVVAKSERYERDFLVSDDSSKKYKVTKLNDICYNPANLKFGVISRNKYGEGIFSPIYVTFEILEADIKFIEYFVRRWDFINKVRKYEEGTVYERQAVKPEDFLKFSIAIPSIDEQTKIANFLSSIDTKIEQVQNQLKQTKEFKKALLQQMFV